MREPHLRRGHVDSWLGDYTLGRLESATDREIEAHLLVCDRCFATLVAQVVIGRRAERGQTPA